MAIRVVVSGAAGRMGLESCRSVAQDPDLELVGAVDVSRVGESIACLAGEPVPDLPISSDLAATIRQADAAVVIDFSVPHTRNEVFRTIVEAGARPVVGTTGWSPADIEAARRLVNVHGSAAIIAPNFSIGAILMMKFAREAARHLSSVEIIELHHDKKLDAPSGTAVKTAEMIASAQPDRPPARFDPARGKIVDGVRIHSVRLPGLLAHQKVIFGGLGETLTIAHDSLSRECFMPGVVLAAKRVLELRELVYGLDNLL